jgi:hypothetical protein
MVVGQGGLENGRVWGEGRESEKGVEGTRGLVAPDMGMDRYGTKPVEAESGAEDSDS